MLGFQIHLILHIGACAGTVILVGLHGGNVDLPLIELVARNMNIQGNYVGTLKDMKELVELLKHKDVQYSAIQFTTPLIVWKKDM